MESKEAHRDSEASSGSFITYADILSNNNDDNSRIDSKGMVSEDEGYVSGYEEFEPELNKSVSVPAGADNPEALAKIDSSPISEVIVSGVEKEDKYTKSEIVEKFDEDEVLGVKEGDEVFEEAEDEKIESLSAGDGVSEPKSEGSELMDKGDVKPGTDETFEEVETKGDEKIKSLSVVDDVSESNDVKPVADEVFEEVETKRDDEIIYSSVGDDVSEPEAKESNLIDTGGVESVAEEDSIVNTIQVDVAPAVPGVAVVGGTQENGDAVNKLVDEVVAEVAVVESAQLEVESRGDVEVTAEGDTVVDTIQVDVVGPGVAVVGEAEQNRGGKIEGVDLQSSEPAAENTVDVAEAIKPGVDVVGDKEEENIDDDYVERDLNLENVYVVKKSEVESEAIENGIKIHTEEEVDEIANQLDITNGDRNIELAADEDTEEESKPTLDVEEIREAENEMDGIHSMSDEDETDGMIFGSSEAAKKFIEELEREESGEDSHTLGDSLLEQSHDIDGQVVTDSEEEGETDDDEGDGKELFDSAALAALLKAATGGDSNGGSITITSQDGSRLFSVERPAGLGSSLQSLRPTPRTNLNRPSLFGNLVPAGGGESEENLSEEEKKKLEKLQQIRVKFLRLVHRLGLTPEESMAAQVLYRLALLGGRQNTQTFSLDAAKRTALQLEAEEKDDLDFSVNMLVLGKSGVGKSATINSIFGEEKCPIDAFENGTVSVKEISGLVDGVKVRVVDTPGLKGSVVEQGVNRSILSSVKKFTKKNPTDVVLYVDRLDAQSRDLNDLPLLKTVTSVLGSTIWRSAIVTLTHSASAPPDGPSGAPLSYEVFVSQRSHVVQQSIGHAVGDLRMMSPSLMNPVSLVENHPSCRKNREGHKILPNGQIWRPQLLLLCYSMKILSEASSLSKPQESFDSRKLFGFRARSPPLPYTLSTMLQSRTHPKLPSDQSGENGDSDIDLDEFSDSDQEEEDEYDQLPPFKPLKKAQIAKLSREQKNAYYEEFDYRVKLLQKKQWKEELRRIREFKKSGNNNNDNTASYDDEADAGAAAPVAVPLPDMALPPSFDGDNPAHRYRFLEPTSQFLARPVLDTHGWDHDCGYDGVNLEHSLAILSRFPAVYTVQITKDKKDFTVSLDSSIAAKHGENVSSMAGFDIQSMGKQLAYIFRAETKIKNLRRNKATGGISFTVLGDNVIPALKVEDQINLGKRYTLMGSAGVVKSQQDTAYGANIEVQRREDDYPIGQVQSTMSLSVVKWRGDLALGFNIMAQLAVGRNSKVAVRAGLNNKMSGQITVRTSSSEHLSLALAAVIPTVLSVYKKLFPSASEKYSIY
ncbi:hypothetical protein CASFOL_008984 [Castilleja foliolosa]|uniref:AIG1-type G domain-containing protein n=1 Tax=Castilleja foliolosa TaxID=1961234 RepID=A0ABD3E1M7_9LAMI